MSHWEALGKSDEWYTPKWIFDALRCQFDMDVAAAPLGKGYVPCDCGLLDGLTRPWAGFVWMNPPFGGRNAIEPWLDRFFMHRNGIALTPDRTSAPWFQKWGKFADGLLFLPKVKFEKPDGTVGKSPSVGTVLWACGPVGCRSISRAVGLGLLVKPKVYVRVKM